LTKTQSHWQLGLIRYKTICV